MCVASFLALSNIPILFLPILSALYLYLLTNPCTLYFNSNEGFMPSNLYTLGPLFPSAGKNRTEIARKEHNERLAADSARNSVSSAK